MKNPETAPRGDVIDYKYKPGAAPSANRPKVIGAANPKLYRELKQKAEAMRKNPTAAEETLWSAIHNKKLGFKFRQQHIINWFIVDFYCVEKSLAVEVDGPIHNAQEEHDEKRDQLLNNLGVNILRFTNASVINNLAEVTKIIIEKATEAPKSPKGDLSEG